MEFLNKELLLEKINKITEDEDVLLYKNPKKYTPEENAKLYICYKENGLNGEYVFYSEGTYRNDKYYVEKTNFQATSPSGDEGYHYTYKDEITDKVLGYFELPEMEEEWYLKDDDRLDFNFKDYISPQDILDNAGNYTKLSEYYLFTDELIELIRYFYSNNYSQDRFNFEIKELCRKYDIRTGDNE